MKYAWIVPLVALPIAACTLDNPAFDGGGDSKADEAGTSDTDTGKQEAGDAGVETGDGDTSTTTTGDGDTSTSTTTTTGDGDPGTTTTTTGESSTDTGMAESSTDTGMAESSTDTGPLDTSGDGNIDTGNLPLCEGLGPDICANTDGCKPAWIVDIHVEGESSCWGGEVFMCLNGEQCEDGGPYFCNGQYPGLTKLVEGDCMPLMPLGWETCFEEPPPPNGPC
jgi:hypothetical protein